MIAALALCVLACPQESDAPPPPPNIVIVLVDDLGWADLGADLPGIPGCADHRTPNLAAFARESLVLHRGYAAAPNCAPSRATLQTGRYTPRHGILTVAPSTRGKAENRALVPVATQKVLADDEITLAEQLTGAGYTSAHVGKWHLGDDARTQGYAHNVAGTKRGHPKSYFSPYKNSALKDGPKGEYLTTRLTDEAIGLMDRMEPPFLLHMAYYTVHTPLQAPKERVAERKQAGARSAKYAAMVEALDHEFGRLMRALEERGIADNTIVLFTSDNGGHMPVTNQTPLRGYKGTLDEGGVRVPWMVRWPGRVTPGVDGTPVHHADVLPTLASVAGVQPLAKTIDGVNLVPLLTERKAPRSRELAWHFPVYLEGKSDRFEGWRTTPGSAIQVDGWKLVEFYERKDASAPRLELYDLSSDPKEANDLADSEPERLASMHRALREWRERVGAQLPTPKPAADK